MSAKPNRNPPPEEHAHEKHANPTHAKTAAQTAHAKTTQATPQSATQTAHVSHRDDLVTRGAMEDEFAKVHERHEKLEAKVDQNAARTDAKIDKVRDEIRDEIVKVNDKIDQNAARTDAKIDNKFSKAIITMIVGIGGMMLGFTSVVVAILVAFLNLK